MTVAMIGFDISKYNDLDAAMNKLIEDSQCFLFNVLASRGSIGEQWAQANGAPIVYPSENNLEFLIKNADYFMIWNDGSQAIHRLIFKIQAAGHHGTILGKSYA